MLLLSVSYIHYLRLNNNDVSLHIYSIFRIGVQFLNTVSDQTKLSFITRNCNNNHFDYKHVMVIYNCQNTVGPVISRMF